MCIYIYNVKTILHRVHGIYVMALISNKKDIFIPFILKQTYYRSADQNRQMILKVAIGAVHHLAV